MASSHRNGGRRRQALRLSSRPPQQLCVNSSFTKSCRKLIDLLATHPIEIMGTTICPAMNLPADLTGSGVSGVRPLLAACRPSKDNARP
jgi:hypothetical protein